MQTWYFLSSDLLFVERAKALKSGILVTNSEEELNFDPGVYFGIVFVLRATVTAFNPNYCNRLWYRFDIYSFVCEISTIWCIF
jgi:hypothetical protein